MIRFIISFLYIILFGCGTENSPSQMFYDEIGSAKAKSFRSLIESYEGFLELNFPHLNSSAEQSRQFMYHMVENEKPFEFDSVKAIQVLAELESSGLRKDIFIYQNEQVEEEFDVEKFLPRYEPIIHDTIEMDTILEDFQDLFPDELQGITHEEFLEVEAYERRLREKQKLRPGINRQGYYNYTLANVMHDDTAFLAYPAIRFHGLHPSITHEYLELPAFELKKWKNQLPLVVDYYLYEILTRYGKYVHVYPEFETEGKN